MVLASSSSISAGSEHRKPSRQGQDLGKPALTVSDKKSFLFALLRRRCFLPLGNQFHCAVGLSKWGHTATFLKDGHGSVVINYGTDTRLVELVEGNNLCTLLLPYPLLSRNSE